MNVSNHFKERYVERVKDVRNTMELKQYVAQNNAMLDTEIQKLFEFSKLIYSGQIGNDNISRNFYIVDNIILVADTQNTTLITLYKIDFGFPDTTNRKVIKDLLEAIDEASVEVEATKEEIDKTIATKQKDIENLDSEVKLLQEQINALKQKRDVMVNEIESVRTSYSVAARRQQHLATVLCNSIDFRNDIKKIQ